MRRMMLLLFLLASTLGAQDVRYGILNKKAPSWGVQDWYQLPDGKKSLDITDFKGKVVYLYCFQSWCPGCHKYGFPTLKDVIDKFKDDSNVAIVAVQTTFEGYGYNGFEQAKQTAKQYRLDIPVGQSGTRKERSELMKKYQTGGTPWVIIIDKQGIVRYNNYHIHPTTAVHLIEELKKARTNS